MGREREEREDAEALKRIKARERVLKRKIYSLSKDLIDSSRKMEIALGIIVNEGMWKNIKNIKKGARKSRNRFKKALEKFKKTLKSVRKMRKPIEKELRLRDASYGRGPKAHFYSFNVLEEILSNGISVMHDAISILGKIVEENWNMDSILASNLIQNDLRVTTTKRCNQVVDNLKRNIKLLQGTLYQD